MRIDPVIDCLVHFYERHLATAPRTKVNPKTERPRLHLLPALLGHADD